MRFHFTFQNMDINLDKSVRNVRLDTKSQRKKGISIFKRFLIFYFKISSLKLVVPINIRFKTFENIYGKWKKGKKQTEPLGHPVYETIGIVPTSGNPLDPRWLFKRAAVSLRVEFF